jgi:hypothetical protein
VNVNHLKNCYLVAAADSTEDSAYLVWDFRSKNTFDCHMTNTCELCYESVNLINCYKAFFSVNCDGCREVTLSKNCVSCSNCIGCVNLRNKQYCIFNEQYSKEEYVKKVAEFGLDSYERFGQLKEQARAFWQTQPQPFMQGSSNQNVTGEYITHSKNAIQCYRVGQVEDSKYCQSIIEGPTRECYDYSNWGQGAELMYEALLCGDRANNVKFSWNCWSNVSNLQYSAFCQNSSDLFGCVGLRNKRYCIFNKQYSQDEYEQLVVRIIEQMNNVPYADVLGRIYKYGEFFPIELSPSEYNVTLAQEYAPLEQQAALTAGYSWQNPVERNYTIVIQIDQMPDETRGVQEDIVGKTIGCAHAGKCNDQCTEVFTIIGQELAFLLEMNLPLPRLCPNCRHYERIAQRSPIELHHRQCMCKQAGHDHQNRCPNELETTYAPDRPEIVYCEDCYQKEVV